MSLVSFFNFTLIFCICCVTFCSCKITNKVITSRDFALTKETRVAVTGLLNKEIEVALLDIGFNVVPAEVMLNKNYTDFSISNQNNSTTGTIQTYSAKYIPAAVLINVEGNGVYRGTFRISLIDLKDERLLASFQEYCNFVDRKRTRKEINRFIQDLSVFLKR